MDNLVNYDYATLETMLRSFLWPFFRISGMYMSMVVFGSRLVSRPIRVTLSFLVTLVVIPVLPEMPAVELMGFNAFIITIHQLLIGIAVGFTSRLIFEAFVLGGKLIAMQSGLGFAMLNDPSSGVSVPVVGQFFLMITTLVFLSLDGHLMMLQIIIQSFDTLPVSTSGLKLESISALINFTSWIFAAGLMMAFAALISLLMINISFGILTKASPALNIMTIGFPMTIIAGLLIVWVTVSGFMPHFDQQFARGKQVMCALVLMECSNG